MGDEDRNVARMWKISRTAHEMVRDRVCNHRLTTGRALLTFVLSPGL